MKIPIKGYAPDADPTVSGVLADCSNLVPSIKGMAGAPAPVTAGVAALSAKALGAALIRKLDNSTRFFAGTQTTLQEAGSATWTDRTRAAGGAYNGGATSIWRFAQFGDVTLAVQKTDVLQSSTTAAFSNLTAPKASIVETVNQFVFLFDTNEVTYGDSPDRWWCSALGNQADWVPAVATQCTTGRLTSSAGPIRAARRLGNNIIAYKERAMYVGQYVGPPDVWDWQEISSEAGASSQETVVPITKPDGGMAHIFMGFDDFYFYDGNNPISIGTNLIRETVFADVNRAYQPLAISVHDRVRKRIYFFYVSTNSVGILDKSVVYNYATGKWGRDNRNVECGVEYIAAGLTYDGLGTPYATYDALPTGSYDGAFFAAGTPVPSIIDTTHTIKTLTGASVSSDFTTGDLGAEERMSLLQRARLEYLTAPTTGSMTNYYRQDGLGDALTTDQTISESHRKFDALREAKWHRLKFSFTGNVEIANMDIQIEGTSGE